MSFNLLIETTPPETYQPMTAGSDPQPAESSTAPKMPSLSSIRHIPHILDHNYGQPPPMTPPDSNSPGPEDGDTGNEDEEDDGVTRCICEFDHDDGYMICCDKCCVWQHIECMGISSDAVPENYLCDQCQPRTLDRERARAIQERKREEQSDDDDDDDSEEDRDTPTYTAVSNTPTRITLTAKGSQKRKRGPNKIKVKVPDIVHVENHEKEKKPRRRKRQKQKPPPGFVSVDEETSEAWENMCNSSDHYEELKENIYSKELENLTLNSIQENGLLPSVANNEQLCKVAEVQKGKKGIVATEDMAKDKFIIQCKGKLMLLSKFESENPFFKRCSLYVFYYSELELCVDARTQGNDARFARRSCTPNSEVRHFFLSGKLCLGIFSASTIPSGSEITIPFEFGFDEYHSLIDCACAQDNCAAMKYNHKLQNQNHESNSQKRFKAHDDDSNSGPPQKLSPLGASLGNSQSLQGDSDSDAENNPEKRGKKSREDRKLEAYLRQFEKMEKKEKRKQQTQKEPKQELISPVSQEVPLNKLSSKNMKVMRRTLNRKRTGRKRARLSSCSSEPLSPDDHSSTASTPTAQELSSVTPSTSPNRSFKFLKDSKQYLDEEKRETLTKDTSVSVKTEPADISEASTPNSPITPREEKEAKPVVISTASSTTDQNATAMPDNVSVVSEQVVPLAADIPLCTSNTADSTQPAKELSNSLTECEVEVNVAEDSGRNTPSPCPSTTGSPTSAESVTSSYSGSAAERVSPGPAPGSPVASVRFGHRSTRTNPLYGSLKKRWLFQYLYGQNLVNERPPNGFKINVSSPMNVPLNGKTIPSPLRRNGLPKIIDTLPLKKRHLKRYREMSSASEQTANLGRTVQTEPACGEPLIVSSPVALEQQVQIVLADSVNDLQPHKGEALSATNEQIPLREELLLKVNVSNASNILETANSTALSENNALTVATGESGILQRRPSDPRLVNNSPVSSIAPVISLGYPPPVVTCAVSPVSVAATIPGQPVLQLSQGNDTSGTPGKKKVSLLEYRNRSRNRLSVDTPRTLPSQSAGVTSVTNGSSSSSLSHLVMKSPSLPNLSSPSTTPSFVHRPISSSSEMNGPHVEPVSPDMEEKSTGSVQRVAKISNSAYGRVSTTSSRSSMFGEVDSRLKRDIQTKHAQEKLTSFIAEQLQKGSTQKSSKPPTVVGRSPSTSTSSESSNPATELTGDAMEIEDEDSNSNSNIYENNLMAAPSSHSHSQHIPHRPSLLSQFAQPNYRISHSQQPMYLATAAPQLTSPSQPPTRLPSSSPQYLVTSPSAPAHVRFQPPYQAAPSQTAGFYHH
nr:inactive histone-lysine N-methyltransferase 2E-like isoform X1 [Pocillopora verrucosa]